MSEALELDIVELGDAKEETRGMEAPNPYKVKPKYPFFPN